jgi:hypothetical protein
VILSIRDDFTQVVRIKTVPETPYVLTWTFTDFFANSFNIDLRIWVCSYDSASKVVLSQEIEDYASNPIAF